jgi:hypothetical protein
MRTKDEVIIDRLDRVEGSLERIEGWVRAIAEGQGANQVRPFFASATLFNIRNDEKATRTTLL